MFDVSQQQRCKVCGRPDKFDFHIADDVWERIVPPDYQARVVCLYCFDDFAAAIGEDYSAALRTLYFAGRRAVFEFTTSEAVDCG